MTFERAHRFPFVTVGASDPGREAPMPPTPVLVVDDEEPVRGLAARMLSLAGLAPTIAEDGVDAVTKWMALDSCPLVVTESRSRSTA